METDEKTCKLFIINKLSVYTCARTSQVTTNIFGCNTNDYWYSSDMERSSSQHVLGTHRRAQILILVALLGDSYPSELARLLGAPLYSVQRIIDGLDEQGVFATRLSGNTRRVSLDPRYFAYAELKRLLLRLAEADPTLRAAAASRRSRPRRARKQG